MIGQVRSVLVSALARLKYGGLGVTLARPVFVSSEGFDEAVERLEQDLGARFPGRPPGARSESAYGTIGDARVAITIDNVPLFAVVDGVVHTLLGVLVEAPGLPRAVVFAREGGGGEDVLTGDPAFDDAVEVHGDPGVVLALLDEDLRREVAAFVAQGGALRAGQLRGRAPLGDPREQVPAMMRKTLALAERLSSAERAGVCPRLALNATRDPLPEVRVLNLVQLQEKCTASPEALATSRAALRDASPWVRLAAARFLRAEVETLEALARDRQVPDQARAEAVALLAARLAAERAGPLLVEILKTSTGDTQRKAVEELGRLRHGPALGPLVVLMERGAARTAAAAASALGALGEPRAEASLLEALGREAVEVRVAAARALGVIGTVRSVEPLAALLESRGLDASARQAIRGAVASIQSRLAGAGAGQLTVASAESESGRLSLAGPGAGDLTLADDGGIESRRPRG